MSDKRKQFITEDLESLDTKQIGKVYRFIRTMISGLSVKANRLDAEIIKPCPFCGCKKIRVWERSDSYWDIQCDDEDAVCAAMLYDHESKEMAIEHWNKRVL